MSISARFSFALALAILLMGTIAAAATAYREHNIQIHGLTGRIQSIVSGNPGLQYFIYKSDREKLEQSLGSFLREEAVSGVQAFNGLGELLAKINRPGAPAYQPASFTRVRDKLLTLDAGLKFFDKATGAPVGTGLLSSLWNADVPLYQSLPVLTDVNTGAAGLTAADFAAAITAHNNNGSQRVAGYINVLIDPSVLNGASLAAGLRILLFNALLAGICGLLAWFMTRKLTRPLRELANMADAVSSGQIKEPIKVEGSGELQEITRLFNSVIEGMKDSRKVHEVDKRLLNLKVEERSSQLSESSKALDKAVEEANETRDRLQRMANYDHVTNLPNRHLFTEQLDLLLKLNQRNGHTLALLFVDLDDFKRVNDSLGISAGDQLMVEVSQRLARTIRDSDSVGHFASDSTEIDVARLGGDEFTVILNQLDSAESARVAAERLVHNLTQPLTVEGRNLALHPSVGIAIAPTDGKDVESLLKAASTAKFHAKQAGGDSRIEFYRSNMGQQKADRLRLESDLRTALEKGGLSLHYQPQVDTHSGSVIGAEALLRWQHPELGPIAPGKLVSLAEEIGLISQLGDWVLREACRQVAEFNRDGVKLGKVAINVSAEQFSPAFVQQVAAAINEAGIQADQLELGLTEAVMSSNDPETVGALQLLRDSGIYLSVDDFGTGYSPLNYLSQYPLDELKIDRSFLLEAGRSKTGANLVVAIIAMARSLGLRVLATGVESESQFHFLTANGANLIQGYMFSKPVPAEQLKPMLAPWHFGDQIRTLAEAAPQVGDARP